MGRVYALLSGENEKVARAIEEHYRPRYAGDVLPVTPEGAAVSLADKMDTIAGCFGVGLIPSGSEDPYALRRQTLGILIILLEKGYTVSLHDMADQAFKLLAKKISRDRSEVRQEVLDYFKARLSGLLISKEHRYDTVEAVLAAGFDQIPDVMARMEALTSFRKEPLFEPFTVVCKRAMNIIKENTDQDVGQDLFQDECEDTLYRNIIKVEKKVKDLLPKGEYQQALSEIASLRKAIDAFFEGVMVMDEDLKIRRNRLNLLTRIAGLVTQIADFSKIVID
jgi:glycyl-tRNA synthetase beta chain